MNSLIGDQDIFDPKWVTKFSEIKSGLKTGDIFLVHGRYPFSWVVALLQGSHWGHCAMVVLAKDIDPEKKIEGLPEIMLWESNVLIKDSVRNEWGTNRTFKAGPMLVDLEKRLLHTQNTFDNVYMAYKPLITDQVIDFKNILPPIFKKFIDKGFPTDSEIIYSVYLGRRYNRVSNSPEDELNLDINWLTGRVRFLGLKGHGLTDLPEVDIDKEKIYCSELLAYTYKGMNLLTQNHVSNAYAPKDFADEGKVALLGQAWLGEEMFIDIKQ